VGYYCLACREPVQEHDAASGKYSPTSLTHARCGEELVDSNLVLIIGGSCVVWSADRNLYIVLRPDGHRKFEDKFRHDGHRKFKDKGDAVIYALTEEMPKGWPKEVKETRSCSTCVSSGCKCYCKDFENYKPKPLAEKKPFVLTLADEEPHIKCDDCIHYKHITSAVSVCTLITTCTRFGSFVSKHIL